MGAVDFTKGALAVGAADQAVLSGPWLLASGGEAVLGQDSPIWAGFRGGQGMAMSLGVLAMLLPASTLAGLLVFSLVYLGTRNFNLSAAIGLGLIVLVVRQLIAPAFWTVYAALLSVSIGVEKALDRPRRELLRPLAEGNGGPA